MNQKFRVGYQYKDILSVSKEEDEFVSVFSLNGSGIGNSGGVRFAKYLNIVSELPCYIVLITRNISHRWYNPWEDIIDYSNGKIYYWGDSKYHKTKKYNEFKGNKVLEKVNYHILQNELDYIPPILHFSKAKSGLVKFSGLCVLNHLELTWFEDKGRPSMNYRCELDILNIEEVSIQWLHSRVISIDQSQLTREEPLVWKNYRKGKTERLDIWMKSVRSPKEQLPKVGSEDEQILKILLTLSPTQFEAVVVEVFKKMPHVSHKIVRTRPTADGGFDFFGSFNIPYPVDYNIDFLGEVKKYNLKNSVGPKDVSRLVARLNRGQYGVFVTTSYYTEQTQKEILADGYPVKLFSGMDLINILYELRLVNQGEISHEWLRAIIKEV